MGSTMQMRPEHHDSEVWIDIDNAPQVLVLDPILKELGRRGFIPQITARDFGQTFALLLLHGLAFRPVGHHAGQNKFRKVAELASRSFRLWRMGRTQDFRVVVSCGARGSVLPALMLGLPLVTVIDYEHIFAYPFIKWAKRILTPNVIPDEDLARLGYDLSKVRKFPGLKEELYVFDFQPDRASLEAALKEHAAAGVLVEPMLQGAGGMVVWPSEFLAGVRRLCDRYGTLMIADEVLTGFGRTGRMFASEHGAVSPDIVCLSKALTAGYLPLGATITTERIFEAFLSDDRKKTFFHGHSFTANPLACAVALASLELFREDDVLGRVRRLESRLRAALLPLADLPSVGDVRVIGGVGIVELVGNTPPSRPGAASAGLRQEPDGYLDGIGPRLAARFLERGLLIRPLGHIVYFMPPYVITDEQVDWALEQIAAVLGAKSV